jgi:hypothetical protein
MEAFGDTWLSAPRRFGETPPGKDIEYFTTWIDYEF